jgi:hypothetical protein
MGDWHYQIRRILIQTPITDVQTQLLDPCFGSLARSGLDDLLTTPSLLSEACRFKGQALRALPQAAQAEQVWQTLLVENSPLSDATRSLLTILQGLGLNVNERRLDALREAFPRNAVDHVLGVSGVSRLVMSNNPFDDKERAIWQAQPQRDPRFCSALKLDAMVFEWSTLWPRLKTWGYKAGPDFTQFDEIMRFLDTWVDRTQPLYCSLSLKADFQLQSEAGDLLRKYVLPLCARRQLGLSLQTPPLGCLELLCRDFPEQRFLATVVSLQEQHQLVELARRFDNLLPVGCWGLLSNPAMVAPLTQMRLDMLGSTFVAQVSDSTVLEQLIGKWVHFKSVLVEVLVQAYSSLESLGYQVESEQIERDLRDLLGESFWRFLGKSSHLS